MVTIYNQNVEKGCSRSTVCCYWNNPERQWNPGGFALWGFEQTTTGLPTLKSVREGVLTQIENRGLPQVKKPSKVFEEATVVMFTHELPCGDYDNELYDRLRTGSYSIQDLQAQALRVDWSNCKDANLAADCVGEKSYQGFQRVVKIRTGKFSGTTIMVS